MQLDRRRLLIGGGAAVGLVVAWAVWPREQSVRLPAAEGESVFGGWLKIGSDGRVVVAVPQCEHGQGAYTVLPQIVADELGADWRTVGVEPAPQADLYGNPLGAALIFGKGLLPADAPMVTGASSSVRQFEAPLRQAGAAARVLLCKAAAGRWGGSWESCSVDNGFVVRGNQRLRFAELAADAVSYSLPDEVPPRLTEEGRLSGSAVPRLDAPPKVDGSANFAGDIRLPDMVFAAIRQGPIGDSRLVRVDKAAADQVPGVLQVVENPRWVAAIGNNWWAANRALEAMKPRFETPGPVVDDARIAAALDTALKADGARVGAEGDVAAAFTAARVYRADYGAAVGLHAAIEPVTATASFDDGKLILWVATQAPQRVRAAAARAAGIGESAVVLHPMIAGGSFGAALETLAAEQAAVLAVMVKRPVQLTWSRAETLMRLPMRPPAAARMTAKLGANGAVLGWHAAIATPPLGKELTQRLLGGRLSGSGDDVAVDGALPIYRFPAWAVDHHAADVGVPAGWMRAGAHIASCFFTESFLDELAHQSGSEPLSYRIGMLGGAARLARCLSTVASLGGWQGGTAGSGQGIACHAMRGSFIALMVEGGMGDGGRPRVDRMVAAVDVGRAINPDLVRQAIEGGLIFGLAAATGASTEISAGLAKARSFRDLSLPRLRTSPDILVELIESDAEPGGASELGVPVVAPALANAIFAGSGRRIRSLPL